MCVALIPPDQTRSETVSDLCDLMGREIVVPVDEKQTEDVHEVRWDGLDERHLPVSAGMYLYRLEAAPHRATGKLLMLK